MDLTRKELELIEHAEQVPKRTRITVFAALLTIMVSFALFYTDKMDSETFAGVCLGFSLLSILAPILGGPNYPDIVALLTKVKQHANPPAQDPIVEALRPK